MGTPPHLAALLLIWQTGLAHAQPAADSLRITHNPGHGWHIQASEVLLPRLLATLAHTARIPIHHGGAPPQTINADCHHPNLAQALACALGGNGDLVARHARTAPGQWAVAEIWLLPSLPVPTTATPRQAAPPQPPIAGTLRHWLARARSADSGRRRQAIAALLAEVPSRHPELLATLERAMADPDDEVRAQAVYGYARHADGKAAELAIAKALEDDSAAVRLMAVDSIGDNLKLLKRATLDIDATVRGLAATKLHDLRLLANNAAGAIAPGLGHTPAGD